MRLALPRIVLASLAALGLVQNQVRAAESRPNIVLIMSDDMGFSDLGCYGGEIETPNLDALAGKGVRFTQFYNTARCCPTRASLLTGLYPHQAGVGHMTNDRGFDGYRGVLNRQSVTIAEALRPAGYRTYMCGKWHVTRFMGPDADRATWPLGRGFDKFYGTIAGAGNYFDPGTLTRQDRPITIANDPDYRPESYYYTDALSDNAVKYIDQHQAESPDKPFFLYLAYTAAHWPMQAPEAAVARYKGRFDAGFEAGRAARFERMKAMGLIPAGTELSPGAGTWAGVENKAWEARCKEVYAAMITTMDAGIGRLVAELKAKGQYDNTVILFLQDNGACAETTGRIKEAEPAPANLKPLGPDQLQPKTAPPMQTRDGRWIRTGPGVMPGPADTYLAYGRDWANVSNTPFREYKHWTHEGGISTPLIAHWPAGIKADRAGQLERQPGHLIDVMATCIDLSGATYPAEVGGQAIKPREGVSLRPAFAGESLNRPQPIFWEHESNRAVRDGRWKLVAKAGEPWELYDIDADRAEQHDLASAQPERAKAMAAQWDAYAARANVLPLGAWREKESGPAAGGSTALRFTLHEGDHLPSARAPGLAGHPFTVEAKFRTDDGKARGVIVAQGGSAAGFTLFVQGDRPRFLLRTGDGVAAVAGPKLTPGDHVAVAKVDADGSVTLAIDGGPATEPAQGKLLARMPKDGLEIGSDEGGAVGPYASPFRFTGKVESVVIEVGK